MLQHDGKNKPVNDNTCVIVRLRYGGIMVGNGRNFVWLWQHSPYPGDVLEYQVLTQESF